MAFPEGRWLSPSFTSASSFFPPQHMIYHPLLSFLYITQFTPLKVTQKALTHTIGVIRTRFIAVDLAKPVSSCVARKSTTIRYEYK